MLIFFAVISWSFFTASGSKFSLSTLQNTFKDVSYTYESGNLANGLVLSDASWVLKNKVRIEARNIDFKWNPKCWRGKEFCVQTANMETLTVKLVETKAKNKVINLRTVNLPLTLVADDLRVKRLVVERPGHNPIQINNIQFGGKLNGTVLSADTLKLNWKWLAADLSGEMRLENSYPLSLNGKLTNRTADSGFPVQGNLQLQGDLLNSSLDSNFTRPFKSTIDGNISFLTRGLPVDLDIEWPEAQIPLKTDNPLLYVRNNKFELSGYWPDYALTGTTDASGPKLPVATTAVTGKLNTRQLTFESLKMQTLNGEISANGTFDFIDGYRWDSAVKVQSIEPHRHWPIVNTKLSGTARFHGRSGNGQAILHVENTNLTGTIEEIPVAISGAIHKSSDDTLQLKSVEISNHQNTVTANGTLSDNSNLAVFFTLAEPGMLYPGLSGDLHADVRITGDKNSPDIDGSASAGFLALKNLHVNNAAIKAAVRANGKKPGSVSLRAESAFAGQRKLDNLILNLDGSTLHHTIKTRFDSNFLSVTNSTITGSLDPVNNWTGKITEVKGGLAQQSIRLNTPVDATWRHASKNITLQPHCWTINRASACFKNTTKLGKQGNVDFKLNNFDITALQPLLPDSFTSATGTLQSAGSIRWKSIRKPVARIRTMVSDAQISLAHPSTANTATIPTAKKSIDLNLSTARMDITTNGNRVETLVKLASKKTGPVNARLQIGLNKKEFPLRGTIKLENAPLSSIGDFFQTHNVSDGSLTSKISLGGTLSDPQYNGHLRIVDAVYAAPQSPMPINKINVDVSFAGDNVTVLGSAHANGRPLSLEGIAQLGNDQWNADLKLKGDKIELSHELANNAIVSPDLRIKLKPDSIAIDGRIKVPQASISLPNIEGSGIPLSNDIIFIDAANRNTAPFQSATGNTIRADVDIGLGRDVQFKGYGLNAQLNGNLNVKINPQRTPELLGEILIEKGTYKSYGQSLIIRDGRINFVGPLEQTAVSVEAVRDAGRVLAGIRIDGSLDDPQSTLFSEPPLPEEVILPYLVLGRPIDISASTDDSQMIANAALFMGITNGRDLTNSIARNLGIDDFTMSATGSGEDTQVQLSGRLNDRLLVRYGLGVFNSANTLFLRYDLAEKLYLETTQGLEKAVDLFYSIEFD